MENQEKIEFIENYLKESFGERFFQLTGPVGLLTPYKGLLLAVECGNVNLGSEKDEILENLKKFLEKNDPKKGFLSFWKVNLSKSDALKKEFLDKYYPDDARFPISPITNEDMEKVDYCSIRCVFTTEDYYIKKSSINSSFSIKTELDKKLYFYEYFDDYLYEKAVKELSESARKNNIYYAHILESSSYLVSKINYIKCYPDEFDVIKKETETSSKFSKWIESNKIYLNKRVLGNDVVFVPTYGSEHIPQYTKKYPDDKTIKNLLVDRKLKTDQELHDFFVGITTFEQNYYTPEQYVISEYRNNKIYDFNDFIKMETELENKKRQITKSTTLEKQIFEKLHQINDDATI